MFQQGTTAVQEWCSDSRGGSNAGLNKLSVRGSVSPPFDRPPHASATGLISDDSVVALSASEILENNESEGEESVNGDPWLGWRSMVDGMSTTNGGLVRGIEG